MKIDKVSKKIKKYKKIRMIEKMSIIIAFISSFGIIYFLGYFLTKGINKEDRLIETIFGIMDIILVLYIVCTPIILIVFIPLFIITFRKGGLNEILLRLGRSGNVYR